MSSIYNHPETYDLEHSGPQKDLDFWVDLVCKERPANLLDLACGNGRVTLPLAEAATRWGGRVLGIDNSEEMLASAQTKRGAEHVEWRWADVRSLGMKDSFDMVVSACASLSHLLTVEEQLSAWSNVYRTLKPGGCFVVEELAPDYSLLAESLRIPKEENVRIDGDFTRDEERLIRYKTASYEAHKQRLHVKYLYDHFKAQGETKRFINDYEAHVYFPHELRLLFVAAGFAVEATWGDFQGSPLKHRSRSLIFLGRKTA